MRTENYIQELLYRYNCVVVPDFGAFLAQVKPAVFHRAARTFDPPTKMLSFNERLSSNDGLLVSYIAHAEKRTYEEQLVLTREVTKTWRTALEKGERLELPKLGELWLNREGRLQFQPCEEVNYLSASFGLSPVVAAPVTREVLKEEVQQLEERIPFTITPESRNRQTIRPYLQYAAVILLALATGMTGFRAYQNERDSSRYAQRAAQEEIQRNIQEATFFNAKPLELPAVDLEVTVKPRGIHHVIAGAFRFRENADKKVRELQNKGYNAAYLGVNRYGLHQVAYNSFQEAEEALEYLHTIKRTVSADAWLLSER